ncbi:MAG: DUF61 family protein [Candidatus Hodarchaeales archaeon]
MPSPFESKLYWKREINKINSNLPKERKTLQQLVDMVPNAFITTKEDLNQEIPQKELKEFANYFSNEMNIRSKIRVPLILIHHGDSYRPSGSKYDLWAIERLFGYEPSDFIISIKDYKPKHDFYYSYQVNRLRKIFPTLIQVVYGL